jgi:hypothetical protein
MQCLLRSILHRGNYERTYRFVPVWRRNLYRPDYRAAFAFSRFCCPHRHRSIREGFDTAQPQTSFLSSFVASFVDSRMARP